MRLVVHIGLHKTGTTSLQLALAQRRADLLAQGVLYPRAAAVEAGGHLNLVWEGTRSWKHVPEAGGIEELIAEAKREKPEVLLISAESLSGYSKSPVPVEIVSHIGDELNCRAEIICTIRHQFAMLDSLYAQNACTGYTQKTFEHYMAEILDKRLLDFEFLLGRWFDHFGTVTLVSVEPGDEEPLEQRFMRAAGLERIGPIKHSAPSNMRPSARVVEYCRVAGSLLKRIGVEPRRKRDILRAVRNAVQLQYPEDQPFSGMTRTFARMVQEHYRSSNLRFRQARLSGERMFTTSLAQHHVSRNVIGFESLNAEERMFFMESFAAALDRCK